MTATKSEDYPVTLRVDFTHTAAAAAIMYCYQKQPAEVSLNQKKHPPASTSWYLCMESLASQYILSHPRITAGNHELQSAGLVSSVMQINNNDATTTMMPMKLAIMKGQSSS